MRRAVLGQDPVAVVEGTGSGVDLTEGLAVTALGMVSSLGLDVVSACAAARAGIVRTREMHAASVYDPDEAELIPVIAHTLATLTDGFVGVARLLRILQPTLEQLPAVTGPQADRIASLGFFLSVGSGYHLEHLEAMESQESEGGPSDDDQSTDAEIHRGLREELLLSTLISLTGLHVDERASGLIFGDQVGVVEAIRSAAQALQTGTVEACLVGGVDSYVDPPLVQALADCGILKSPENPMGIAPGEGAALFQLELPDQARRRGAEILAYLESPQILEEPITRFSDATQGVALREAISKSLAECKRSTTDVRQVIGALNGDSWRANEWGNVLPSLPEPIRSLPLWSPAQSFGELGAASAAVAVCVGTRNLIREDSPGDSILIWQSNDDGRKAAVVLAGA